MMELYSAPRRSASGPPSLDEHGDQWVNLKKRPFQSFGDGGHEMLAETVIISDRAQTRRSGSTISSRRPSLATGVSACATCDGFFSGEKEVGVVEVLGEHGDGGGQLPRQDGEQE